MAMFEKWAERGRTPSTVRRFRQVAASLDRFVKGKPAGDVTNDEVWAWAMALTESKRAVPRTHFMGRGLFPRWLALAAAVRA